MKDLWKKVFGVSDEDEKKMRMIIKNTLKNKPPKYSERELKALCRVSFISTYGKLYPGNMDKMWEEVCKK